MMLGLGDASYMIHLEPLRHGEPACRVHKQLTSTMASKLSTKLRMANILILENDGRFHEKKKKKKKKPLSHMCSPKHRLLPG